MKRSIIFISILTISLFVNARTYTLGTYNIRIAKSEDTGLNAWESRKGALVNSVLLSHVDVCAFQEIYNDNQEQDLRTGLATAGYDLYSWGRGSNTIKTGERLAVAWNDSILEKLDQGFYFHTFNPTQTGIVLDASHARLSVWVKLRDRETGDIFYYFSTHLDVQGKRARRDAAWLNNQYVRSISGNYPAVLAGDFNVDGGDQTVLGINKAYMKDSYLVTETTPVGPYRTHAGFVSPSSIGATGGARMDFVLSKGFSIHSYKVDTEDFGRGVVPSDHLLVYVTATPISWQQCEAIRGAIYVNPEVQGEGDGTKQFPFRTLDEALTMAHSGDTIRCVAGTLHSDMSTSPRYIITKSIFLEGGYDEQFVSQDSVTTLDGENANALIRVDAGQILSVSRFAFNNAMSMENGAAISMQGVGMELNQCTFSHCSSGAIGGAVYSTGKIIMDSCSFIDCQAVKGGALYVATMQGVSVHRSMFTNNVASQVGGAIYTDEHYGFHLEANYLADNQAPIGGALYLANHNDTQQTLLTNNFLKNNTSGVKFHTAGKVGLVSNTIINHLDTAVSVELTNDLYLVNNIIAANTYDLAYNGAESLRVDKFNVFTTTDHVEIKPSSKDYVAETADSAYSYIAALYDDSLTITNPIYGKIVINKLSSTALKEVTLTVDLSGDYQYQGMLQEILHTDLKGYPRPLDGTATIGAIEYVTPKPTDIYEISDTQNINISGRKTVKDNQLLIYHDGRWYNLHGTIY